MVHVQTYRSSSVAFFFVIIRDAMRERDRGRRSLLNVTSSRSHRFFSILFEGAPALWRCTTMHTRCVSVVPSLNAAILGLNPFYHHSHSLKVAQRYVTITSLSFFFFFSLVSSFIKNDPISINYKQARVEFRYIEKILPAASIRNVNDCWNKNADLFDPIIHGNYGIYN